MQPRDVVLHALTRVTATDETHANATVLFDLRERTWSGELLDAAELEAAALSRRGGAVGAGRAAVAGRRRSGGGGPGCPVVIGAADSQCAAYGAG